MTTSMDIRVTAEIEQIEGRWVATATDNEVHRGIGDTEAQAKAALVRAWNEARGKDSDSVHEDDFVLDEFEFVPVDRFVPDHELNPEPPSAVLLPAPAPTLTEAVAATISRLVDEGKLAIVSGS